MVVLSLLLFPCFVWQQLAPQRFKQPWFNSRYHTGNCHVNINVYLRWKWSKADCALRLFDTVACWNAILRLTSSSLPFWVTYFLPKTRRQQLINPDGWGRRDLIHYHHTSLQRADYCFARSANYHWLHYHTALTFILSTLERRAITLSILRIVPSPECW